MSENASLQASLQVDFYVLPSSDSAARVSFACRLIDKAWRLGHRIAVRCASAEQCQTLDAQLWALRTDAFVPHALSADDPAGPVVLGHGAFAGAGHDLLINLCDDLPSTPPGLLRLAEIVLDDPALRQAARERYSFYRDQGYALQNHRLTRI